MYLPEIQLTQEQKAVAALMIYTIAFLIGYNIYANSDPAVRISDDASGIIALLYLLLLLLALGIPYLVSWIKGKIVT